MFVIKKRPKVHLRKSTKRTVIALLALDVIVFVLWLVSAGSSPSNPTDGNNPFTTIFFALTCLFTILPLNIILHAKDHERSRRHLHILIFGLILAGVSFFTINQGFYGIVGHESIVPLVIMIVLTFLGCIWFATLFIYPLWAIFKE